jgi:hypothetical protein
MAPHVPKGVTLVTRRIRAHPGDRGDMKKYYDINGKEIKLFDIAICQRGIKGVITEVKDGHPNNPESLNPVLFIGFRLDSELGDRRTWQSLSPRVIGGMLPVEEVVTNYTGTDRGVACRMRVTTLPNGHGVIETDRDCSISGYSRRSFSSTAERDKLIARIKPAGEQYGNH